MAYDRRLHYLLYATLSIAATACDPPNPAGATTYDVIENGVDTGYDVEITPSTKSITITSPTGQTWSGSYIWDPDWQRWEVVGGAGPEGAWGGRYVPPEQPDQGGVAESTTTGPTSGRVITGLTFNKH